MRRERRPVHVGALLTIGVASLLSPVVLVLVSGYLIRLTATPSVSVSRQWPFLISIGLVLVASALILPFIPLTQRWLPQTPALASWCSAFPMNWTLACSVPLHGSGAAVVAVVVYALVSAAAYRDAVQRGSARAARVQTDVTSKWFALIAFVACCVADTAFVIVAGFTGHPPSGPTSNLVFFVLMMVVLAWALHALTRELLTAMVTLLR